MQLTVCTINFSFHFLYLHTKYKKYIIELNKRLDFATIFSTFSTILYNSIQNNLNSLH